MRSSSGASSLAFAPDRVGEAQPFLAIVVAMLEHVLGDGDAQPGARLARGSSDEGGGGHHRDEPELAERGPSRRRQSPSPATPTSSRSDRRGWRSPRATGRSRRARSAPSSSTWRGCRARTAAPSIASTAPRIANSSSAPPRPKIGDGVEVKIVEPHRRQREHREAQRAARPRASLAVEVVDQDQRAGGDGQAEDLAGRHQGRWQPRSRRNSGITPPTTICRPITAATAA